MTAQDDLRCISNPLLFLENILETRVFLPINVKAKPTATPGGCSEASPRLPSRGRVGAAGPCPSRAAFPWERVRGNGPTAGESVAAPCCHGRCGGECKCVPVLALCRPWACHHTLGAAQQELGGPFLGSSRPPQPPGRPGGRVPVASARCTC